LPFPFVLLLAFITLSTPGCHLIFFVYDLEIPAVAFMCNHDLCVVESNEMINGTIVAMDTSFAVVIAATEVICPAINENQTRNQLAVVSNLHLEK